MTTSEFVRPGSAADRDKKLEARRFEGGDGVELFRLIHGTPDESLRLEDNGAGTVLIGKAIPGAAESSPVWQIKKILTSGGNMSILFPEGSADYGYSWASRAGYVYS